MWESVNAAIELTSTVSNVLTRAIMAEFPSICQKRWPVRISI